MTQYTVTFEPNAVSVSVDSGTTILQSQILAGLLPDAPCGGRGTCGKCRVFLDGTEVPACQTPVDRDMTVFLPRNRDMHILSAGQNVPVTPDGTDKYALAFDIGTTTVVAYLLDGITGRLICTASCRNPQSQYGADVISRLQYAVSCTGTPLQECIVATMNRLILEVAEKADISPSMITCTSIVGNTAMHHLFLGIDPKPLTTPPYMPKVSEALEMEAHSLLPVSGTLRLLPNIAGFIGGDTVGCMVATRFDQLEELTLLIDIGTNGEMVLGDKNRRIACSTAAGPAFEGAKISCGMRGAAGAVDHVTLQEGQICFHVIGEQYGTGLCGSGLLDLVAVLLDQGIISQSGRMKGKKYTLQGTDVVLTQKDVREVQLAKGAIRAGIELLCEKMGVEVADIQRVCLAGAFGSKLTPASACRIGMIPTVLADRITPVGNAAGEGARLCALSRQEFAYSRHLADNTEFLELASLPQFQNCFLKSLSFDFPEST